jgi:hypothetical protein
MLVSVQHIYSIPESDIKPKLKALTVVSYKLRVSI